MSAGDVRTQRAGRFVLEGGEVLPSVRQAVWTSEPPPARLEGTVLLFHALTGGPDPTGWWPGVVGPGLAIDTDRFRVLCPNLLGSCYGTTFRRSRRRATRGDGEAPDAAAPLEVTTRDMARLAGLLLDELGIASVDLVAGGSLGGMVTLEWAALFPDRARAAVVLAAPAQASAYSIGWNHVQREAILAGGEQGLALARMVGMITYRTAGALDARFGRSPGRGGEPFAVQSWLTSHGEKLVARFDVASYLSLLHAMDSHDVARGRGTVRDALAAAGPRLVGVGIPGDLLYRDEEVRGWTREAGAAYRSLVTPHGHDGFLLEAAAVGALLGPFLDPKGAERGRPEPPTAVPGRHPGSSSPRPGELRSPACW